LAASWDISGHAAVTPVPGFPSNHLYAFSVGLLYHRVLQYRSPL